MRNSYLDRYYQQTKFNGLKLIINKLIIIMILIRALCHSLKTVKQAPSQYDFLDLIRAPTGSHIFISKQQKQKINLQIDKKLQQLQETGLSRQEILLSKSQKGLPLAIDPFFQYLKNNRLAREVYLKRDQRFSVQKVIDIALRQDIGPDASYSRVRDYKKINEKGRAQLMNDLQQRQRTSFNPSSYNANIDTDVQKLYDELKPHQTMRFMYKPINRYERIKTHQKRLKKYDIHWRNVELLRHFLTPYGNIKNRWSNRLSPSDQKKVKMAIKTARHNCAIPYYGRILNPNKKNITSLQEQVKEIGLQNVNLLTGQIYYSRARSMDSIEVEQGIKNDVDYKYKQMIQGNSYQLWIDTPQKQQDQQIVNAQRYARHLKAKHSQLNKTQSKPINLKKLALKQIVGVEDDEDKELAQDLPEVAKENYEKRKKVIGKKIKEDPLSFSQIIIDEKTLL